MTIEDNPDVHIQRATTARITALQDTLRHFRQQHEAALAPNSHMTHLLRPEVHRRHVCDDKTPRSCIEEVGLSCG